MILITGASGNVGSEVLKQAVDAGLALRAAYQSPEKAERAPASVHPVVMNYAQPDTIAQALQGVEKVFLVGPPTRELPEMEANFVRVARAAGQPLHVVKLSAMGGRAAIFPRMHNDSENNIRDSGLAYTFLRPNGFMQNFVNYNGATIASQNAWYGSQGQGAVSHIDVRDIAAVAVNILAGDGHVGAVYELTGPETLTNEQIAEKISRAVGHKVSYVDLGEADLKQGMLSAGLPEWSADALLDLTRLYREGGASNVTQEVERLTGRPATSFDAFLRDYAPSFQPAGARSA